MGLSPQLPLEAAIAADTGFANVPAGSVATLRYIRASGGDPPGEQADIKTDDLAVLAANTLDGLKRHIAHYDDEKTPYRPLRRKGFSYDFDEYAHLARVAEWSVVDRDCSDEGEA